MSRVSQALFFAGLFLAARTSLSQTAEFLVESWTVADGVPSPTVAGLARGNDGFLWVGTDKGLARFDGLQFSPFTRENFPGLRSDYIQHMAAGPDSRLYIATWGGGLTVYHHGRARAFATAEGTKSNVVQVVLPVGNDEAWFGTDIGNLYHYRNGSIAEAGANELPREAIYGLARAPDGTLWIGTGNGLFYLRSGSILRYRPKIPLPIIGIFDLVVTDAGNVFAGSDQGVFEIESDHWRHWAAKDGLPGERIQVMTAAPGNVLWVGTDVGIARLAQGRIGPVKTPFCSVTAMTFDVEKSLWAGCSEGQTLLRLREPAVRMLPLSAEYGLLAPNSLVEDKKESVWMGTGHGLLQWRNGRAALYTRKNGLPTNRITSVSLAPDDSIWIGTENGFAHMRNDKIQRFRIKKAGTEDLIYSIRQDRAGNLWAITSTQLLRRAPGRARFEEIPGITGFVSVIREARNGDMLAATRNLGLTRLAGNSAKRFTTACGMASNMVYDVAETAAGDLWAASENGLTRIRNGQCVSIRSENGIPPGRMVAIELDSQNHLWFKASGITGALALEDADRVADHGGIVTGLRIFGDDDGFGHQLDVAQPNAILLHSSGEMWFSTRAGVGRVDPAILGNQIPTLKPQVDSVSSDVGDHDLAGALTVRAGDLHLRFAYSASSLIGAKAREFRYRLAGFDPDWRTGGKQRDAVYTSLPPGTYQFHVGVRRPFESWNDIQAPLDLRVLPTFYQTWWWRLLLALACIAVILSGYRLRLLAMRKHYAVLMAERLGERSRLARELHDTLARGMVGIRGQVAAAQVLLDVEPNVARKHLDKVESIAREALAETRNSIAELRSDEANNTTLHEMLRAAISNFARETAITPTLNIMGEIPAFDPEITYEITRVVEEALANVRLHSEANHAGIRVSCSGGHFVLDLSDDGKGFDVSSVRDSAGHFGIAGMQERAKRIHGRLDITSRLGKGTRVVLKLRLHSGLFRIFLSNRAIRLGFGRSLPAIGSKVWHSLKKAFARNYGKFR